MASCGPYSHSRLECYRKCPRQFSFRYVDRIPARQRGVEAFMGSRVHEALEHLYRECMGGRVLSRDELIAHYDGLWEEAFGDDVRVVREERDPADYRRIGAECLGRYHDEHHPFADAERTLALEQLVEFDLGEDAGYPIRGYADRLVRGEDDRLEIHDYKTSARLPSKDQVEADGQLALYQVGLGEVFEGQCGVRLVWHYVAHGKRIEIEKSEAELEALVRRMRRTIDEVEAAQRFEARTSVLCRWCDYQDLCPEGRRLVDGRQSADWTEAGFVRRYAGIKQAAAAPDVEGERLRREATLLQASIRDHVNRTGRSEFAGAQGKLVVQPPEADNGARWVMRLEREGKG